MTAIPGWPFTHIALLYVFAKYVKHQIRAKKQPKSSTPFDVRVGDKVCVIKYDSFTVYEIHDLAFSTDEDYDS